MMKRLRNLICLAAAVLPQAGAQSMSVPLQSVAPRKAATPVDAISAIVNALRSHPLVALGNVEFRGNEQCHAFQLSLLRDPGFTSLVDDILVEFGSARYQDVMDRFVRGEEVPDESLRQVWQNTTQVEYEWDLPIYEDFFRTVRQVNASLPRTRKLRILLGDPPMDWDQVHSLEDLRRAMGDRDAYAVDVLRREVLAKGRRALIIYGGQHLLRQNTVPGAAEPWAHGIVARLEKDNLARVFTVIPETRRDLAALQPGADGWPAPALAILRDTALGAATWDPAPQRRAVRMEDQFDAILYLGPPSSMTASKLPPALCADRAYMDMRLRRLRLMPSPSGTAFSLADQLQDDCANPQGHQEIADGEPAITDMLRKTLQDAARGKVNRESVAPESREKLIPFLERDGPRYLGPAGELKSLTLLADTKSGGKRVRRYRSVFANGLSIIWTVALSSAGTIVSMDPRPE